MELLELFKNIADILVPVIGYMALNTWRTQKKYELAEDIMCSLYESMDAFAHIRCPLSLAGETEAKNSTGIVEERYKKHENTFLSLKSKRNRAKFAYDSEFDDLFDEYGKLENEFFIAINSLKSTYYPNQNNTFYMERLSDEEKTKHLDEKWKCENIMWSSLDENDEFNNKLKDIVSRFKLVFDTMKDSIVF